MGGGESRDREAGAAVDRQSTDDDPAAAPRCSDSHGRKIWVVAVQDDNPTPRGADDSIGRRGKGNGQLGQRRVADVDARTPAAETEAVKS